jgi:basic amino acid/polyamine antiporter, APA family
MTSLTWIDIVRDQGGTMSEGKFARQLKARDVVALSFGAMIGWSWVAVAGDWIGRGGSLGSMIAFAIGGVAILLIALTYAELASAMPKAGGEHVYTERAMGPGWSFICTWAIILAYVGVCAFESVAIATVAEYFFPGVKTGYLWTIAGYDVYAGSVAIGMGATLLITILNIVGVRPAAIFQAIATLLIVIGGIVLVTGASISGSIDNAEPLFITGFAGIAGVLVMVPGMLVGFDVIPQSAEEIDLPRHQIGRILIISVMAAVLWYILIVYGVSFSIGEEIRASAPITTAAAASAAWHSSWAGDMLVLAGLGGILTSWNAFAIGGSRAIYAVARAGHLPGFLGHIHSKFKTPIYGVVMIGVVSFIAPLFGRQSLIWIIDSTGLAIVFAYGLVAWSFVVLRRKEPQMERPYRVRYGKLVGWGAVAMSFSLGLLYLPGSPSALVWPEEWGILLVWSALGIALYASAKKPAPTAAQSVED